MESRRAALLKIAGAAASSLILPANSLAQHAGHEVAEAAVTQTYEPIFFKDADYKVVSCLAELILPRTDTPGAIDAHVPYRIDHEVALSDKLQQSYETGLKFLQTEASQAGGADFTSLSQPQQTAILNAMCEAPESPAGEFFTTVKHMTVDWYYRSEEGLVQELGFHGNTFRSEFPGCTHPEHWPVQEAK